MSLNIEVNGIKSGDVIPNKFTCEGKNLSPEINITGAPAGTESFAIIVEDPDAPVGIFVHWVIYNIGSSISKMREGIEKSAKTGEGFLQGKNDFGRIGYDGPCPPRGHGYHRYFFKLYALRSLLTIQGNVTREGLLKAMEGKIVEQAEFMGRYRR
ncbi:MAG: YbhB/YbcL family Raf kinase inhibitor-like protein [Thermoplasmatales archaeon]